MNTEADQQIAAEIAADNLEAEAHEAGFKTDIYTRWLSAAREAGVTIEEYIAGLPDEEIDAARVTPAEGVVEIW